MAQIEFINITKEYEPGFQILNDVSLVVDPGEFIFLVGPSGAGKSSLIRLLIREDTPTGGDILFNGDSILSYDKKQITSYRRKIGVVFQDFKLLNSKNVFENVAIALEVVNAPVHEIQSVVPNVLSMVGLTEKMFQLPKYLSGGEKQRVAIARALAHEPDVLVADEATGMIDPDATKDIVKIIEKINSLGTTVMMATHDEDIVNKLKKRVIRIEDGKIVSDKKGGKYRG